MTGEIDIYGVFVAPLLVWAACAYLLSLPVRRLLAGLGLYRLVWHRPLFDLALFVILLGGVVALSSHWTLS